MKRVGAVLAPTLGLALVAVSPGLLPYQAAAQVVAGPRGWGAPTVAVVIVTGAPAAVTALSPASLAPVLAPVRTPSALTVSALRAPAAASAAPAVLALPRAARVTAAPTASSDDDAAASPLAGADAKTQLSTAGAALSRSSEEAKPKTLDAVFHGPRAARPSGDGSLPVPAGSPQRENRSGLADSSGSAGLAGRSPARPALGGTVPLGTVPGAMGSAA